MKTRFSIIVPVLNESAGINPTIGHLRRLIDISRLSAEIIVADGDPQAKTIAAIQDDRVMVTVGEKGRGRQMNHGAKLSGGDILLFLHADTRLPDDGLSLIDAACGHPAQGAGAFDLAIDSAKPVFRLIEKTASLRSRLTGIPYGDQAFFFAADYFRALGGFADIPLMEDVEIMCRMKKRGDRIIFIDRPAQTSARRWEKEGVWKCTLRNWCLISLYLAGVSPGRLAGFYRVHAAGKTA
jgi:rSAM/selenodomain-associated transferase 2